MFRTYPEGADDADAIWIDLMSPDDRERETVERRYGIHIPDLKMLREIEISSRLRVGGDALYMSAPLIAGTHSDHWQLAPTGFILTPNILVTIHYAEIEPVAAVADRFDPALMATPGAAFMELMEDIVDRAADHLEQASEIVSNVSQSLFFQEEVRGGLARETKAIREIIRNMGQASDRASRVRYAFLSIGRMVDFVLDRCNPKLDQAVQDRLAAIRHDIGSLDEFETSLEGRIQLLQDAATAFISIEQNDVVKILTVASVVGIPPVLVVGIYGMNFRYMPELSWTFGYPLALVLCLISALLPYLLFKWQEWI